MAIVKKYWYKGYEAEVAQATLKYGHNTLGISIFFEVNNIKSVEICCAQAECCIDVTVKFSHELNEWLDN